jgi:hypothetical protein
MGPLIKSLGSGGLLGGLIGIGLVIWVEPTTVEGAGLLILVSVVLVGLLVQTLRAISRAKRRQTSD